MQTVKTGFLGSLIGYHLKAAYFALLGQTEDRLKRLGITPQQFTILAMISINPRIIQTRLIESSYISRSRCSELIEQVIRSGYAIREPIDRRSHGLSLSKDGQRLVENAYAILSECERELSAHMTQDEITTLMTLLQKFSEGQSSGTCNSVNSY